MSSTASLQVDVGPSLGSLLIGLVLGAVFLGITFLQTVFYYRTYPKDTLFLKSLVGALCALDALSLALWAHANYWYLILHFGDLTGASTVIWSDAAEPPVTGIIALVVHLFLAWRIQILDVKWRIFAILLVVASFVSLLSPIAASVIEAIGMHKGSSINTVDKAAQWCNIIGNVFSAVVDVAIAGSIAYLLHRSRGGFTKTNRILNALTLYIVTSGAITTIVRLLALILAFAYPTTLYFIIPYISTSKAYTNALLATLNSRASRREGLSSSGTRTGIEWRGETNDTFEEVGMSSKGRSGSDLSTNLNAEASGSDFSTDVGRPLDKPEWGRHARA